MVDGGKEMMKTEEGREKMMDMIYGVWKNVEAKGERTCGFDEMMKMEVVFAPMHDETFGGHWVYDKATAKADYDFTVHHFGDGGRISFPQYMAQIGYFMKWIQPFVDTPTLSEE